MRRFIDMLESPSADVEQSNQTMVAYRALSDYAHRLGDADIEIHFHDGIRFGFDTAHFGGPEVFGAKSLIILIGQRTGSVEGRYVRLKPGTEVAKEWTHAIFMDTAREETAAAAISSIATVPFMQAFQHEMIHCLDDARTGKVLDTHRYNGREVTARTYFNNPWEFNAFYHGIIDRWVTFIRESEGQSPEQIQELATLWDLTGDFKADLAHAVRDQKLSQKFLKELSDPRRKALLRRLFRTYQGVRALLSSRA